MTIEHYRDIGSYLSKSPKITMASVNKCDSCSHLNIAFLLYNYCIIKAYLLFELNKLIQQFWICARQLQILELNVHFIFLYKLRQSDVRNS